MAKQDRQSRQIKTELIPLLLEQAELQARIREVHARQDAIAIEVTRILDGLGKSPGWSVVVGELTFRYDNPTGGQPWVVIENQRGEWIGGDTLIRALSELIQGEQGE